MKLNSPRCKNCGEELGESLIALPLQVDGAPIYAVAKVTFLNWYSTWEEAEEIARLSLTKLLDQHKHNGDH